MFRSYLNSSCGRDEAGCNGGAAALGFERDEEAFQEVIRKCRQRAVNAVVQFGAKGTPTQGSRENVAEDMFQVVGVVGGVLDGGENVGCDTDQVSTTLGQRQYSYMTRKRLCRGSGPSAGVSSAFTASSARASNSDMSVALDLCFHRAC